MSVILVRYAEIALKGANRSLFENQLRKNIIRKLEIPDSRVQLLHSQIVVRVPENLVAQALDRLREVFGIAWFAPAAPCTSEMEAILRTGRRVAAGEIQPGQTFAVRAQRSDKSLPFTSVDIERKLGTAVLKATAGQVDLENPEVTVHVVASYEGSYIFIEKMEGPGGLPVGTSGQVLALLSGGIDSIAAAYMLAKRGAQVDYLHFHVFPDITAILDSPITEIVQGLDRYTAEGTATSKLFLASYLPFEMRVLDLGGEEQRYELVLFRRLMVRVGEELARRYGYQALLLGDSLGQVASQTMENIVAVDEAISLSIFRPLVGMDKKEIMELVREIGLFQAATAPYKDCCSIIAANPVIKAYLPIVHKLEKRLDMEQIVQDVVGSIELVEVADLVKTPTGDGSR